MERETIGERYTVEARIGQGGMAEVFRGFDPSLDRTGVEELLRWDSPVQMDGRRVSRLRVAPAGDTGQQPA